MAKNVDYAFRLILGENIKSATMLLDELTLDQRCKVSFTVANGEDKGSYTISLQGVKFDRNIYHPGEIDVEVSIAKADDNTNAVSVPSLASLERLLMQRFAKLFIMRATKDGVFGDFSDLKLIASNYFVHEMYPQVTMQAGVETMTVKLKIFSMDKLMTLNKYSKAYVAKRLGADILKTDAQAFGYEKLLFDTDVTFIRNLAYDTTTAEGAPCRREFIHPYLVQYNESFYDFMVRTANRCGEFLYFEDGKLNLGLNVRHQKTVVPLMETKDGETVQKKDAKGNPVFYDKYTELDPEVIDNYARVTYQNVSRGPLAVQGYSYDSVKENNGDMSSHDTNFSQLAYGASGYPANAFAAKPAFNVEQATDEYIFPLYKDKFSTDADWGKKWGLNLLGSFLKNTDEIHNILDFGTKYVIDQTSAYWDAKEGSDQDNKDGNTGLKDSTSGLQPDQYDDGTAPTKVTAFAANDPSHWVSVNYYTDIRAREEEAQRQIICIDMGTEYKDVKLGDKIKVKNMPSTYIVIQIKLVSSESWSRDYERYGDAEGTTDKYALKQSMKIFAIPVLKEKTGGNDDAKEFFMPPVADVPVIRKAGSQTAFVVSTADPKAQGRVRIVFPWQAIGDLEMKALSVAVKKLEEATEEEQKKIDAISEAREQLKMLRRLKAFYEGVGSKAESDAKRKSLADENKDLKERIAIVQKLKKNPASVTDAEKARIPQIARLAEIERSIAAKEDELRLAGTEREKAVISQEISALKYQKEMVEAELGTLEETLTAKKKVSDEILKVLNEDSTLKKELDKKNPDFKAVVNQLDAKVKAAEKAVVTAEDVKADASALVANATLAVEVCQSDVSKAVKKVATPWVRQATPMATLGGGVKFMLNTGDEVLVDFENGNIERPYVVGSLYSKNVSNPTVPYTENFNGSGSMTMMTPNGQYISLDGNNKPEKFWASVLPVLKPLKNVFGSKADKAIGQAAGGKELVGSVTIGDRHGMFKIAMSSEKRSVNIESPFGNVSVNAFTGITISAPNGDIKISGKNVSIEAGNNLKLTSGTNCGKEIEAWVKNLKKDTKNTLQDFGKALGQSVVSKGMDTVLGHYGLDKPVVDVALVRSLIDIWLRPIEGTLNVKSNNYLMLQAGKGKATISADRYSADWQKFQDMTADAENQLVYNKVNTYISTMSSRVDDLYSDYKEKRKNAIKLRKLLVEQMEPFMKKNVEVPIADITNAAWDAYQDLTSVFKPYDDQAPTMKLTDYWKDNNKLDLPPRTVEVRNAATGAVNVLQVPPFEHKPTGRKFHQEDEDTIIKPFLSRLLDEYAKAVFELHKTVAAESTFCGIVADVNGSVYGSPANGKVWVEDWIDECFRKVVYDGSKVVKGIDPGAQNPGLVDALLGGDQVAEGSPRTQIDDTRANKADPDKSDDNVLLLIAKDWRAAFLDDTSHPKDSLFDPKDTTDDPYASGLHVREKKVTKRSMAAWFICELDKHEENKYPAAPAMAAAAAALSGVEEAEKLLNPVAPKDYSLAGQKRFFDIKFTENDIRERKYFEQDKDWEVIATLEHSFKAGKGAFASSIYSQARPYLEKMVYGNVVKKYNSILGGGAIGTNFVNEFGKTWVRGVYNSNMSGQILLSAEKDQTFTINKKGEIAADKNSYKNSLASVKKSLSGLK